MKIAYFVNEFPGFSQTFVIHQIAGMVNKGHEVDIYATVRANAVHLIEGVVGQRCRTIYFSDLPVAYFARYARMARRVFASDIVRNMRLVARVLAESASTRQALSLRLLHKALSIERGGEYDILHCQFATLGLPVLQLKRIGALTGKVVVSVRGYDVTTARYTDAGRYASLFENADRFLPVSESLADRLLSLGCDRQKIQVLRSGLNVDAIAQRLPRPLTTPLNLLSVGRLVEKKGLIYGLGAVAALLAQGIAVRYRIAGEGPLRDELMAAAQDLGVAEAVEMPGVCAHDRVIGLMQEADIFLAPSVTAADGDQEGIPNVVKEAMLMGLPVISTRHSGIPELIEHGREGVLVAEKDSAALVEAVKQLGAMSAADLAAMCERARAKVVRDYDEGRLNDELERIYSTLAG